MAYNAETASVAAITAKHKLTNSKKRSKNDILRGYRIKITGVCHASEKRLNRKLTAGGAAWAGSIPTAPLGTLAARNHRSPLMADFPRRFLGVCGQDLPYTRFNHRSVISAAHHGENRCARI
jgi:hypothetical protein